MFRIKREILGSDRGCWHQLREPCTFFLHIFWSSTNRIVFKSAWLMWLSVLLACNGCMMIQKEASLVIGFAGDVMLGRMVNEMILHTNYTYPWGDMLNTLRSTDFNIINLETTLTNSMNAVPKVFNFKAAPRVVQTLKEAHIDLVNLANNHSRDFNDEGLLETIQVLDDAGIYHVGAGSTMYEAKKPVIVQKNGMRLGIIGYTDNEPGWLAGENKPGTNYIHVGDRETVKKDLAQLRDTVDLIILSIHWGPNKIEQPTQEFIDFAHAMIDAGVDIIHGHSAHIFQGIELYKQKLIMYNAGDFVDDYAIYPDVRNDYSFFYEVQVTSQGIQNIKLIPVLISTMQVNHAFGEDYRAIVDRMQKLCAVFGTRIEDHGTYAQVLLD